MQQVLRYFHQDPKKSVQSSSTQLIITQMSLSINNNKQALEDKQNTIPGKSLSSNDFTDYYKNKLNGIEEEAEVNVQANWDENDSTADSYIQNKPGIDTVVTEDSNNLITSGAVFNAIDELPEPMIFKGSLGTGGTIQVLPTADNTNVGYTYKVITAGTYAGKTAKPGDTYISDGTEWILIPSGDEPDGTVTNVAMTVPTGLSVSGSPITTSGTLAITYAVGYAIPTLTDQATWTAKQDAISDLSTIRSRADEGHTAYGWGDHSLAGYVKSSGVTSITIKGTSPVKSDNATAITSTGTRTISLEDAYGDTKNPYGVKTKNKVLAGPSTGADAVPTFRSLVSDDIPTLGWNKISATVNTTTVGSASTGTAISADDITAWDAGTTPTLGTAIAADDITKWTTNTPTKVTKKTVVTGVTANTVVTGGSTTDVPNISSKTVVTTVSVSKGVLTISTGASVTTGTAIKAYTSLTTGDSVAVTTGDSVTVTAGTAATLNYTARSIPNVTSVGTVPSLSYTARSIPNISVTSKTVVTGITTS